MRLYPVQARVYMRAGNTEIARLQHNLSRVSQDAQRRYPKEQVQLPKMLKKKMKTRENTKY